MSPADARLEILKILIPAASKVGISEPEQLVKISRKFEEYVLESRQMVEGTPDSTSKRPPGRPRKEKPIPDTPAFLTPPDGGQVEPSPR